jgi:hypothetical protein
MRFLEDNQVELILVAFTVTTVFRAAVGEHAQQPHVLFFEERQHAIVEQIRGHQRVLAVLQLHESHLRIGIEEVNH